ncbi:MAG: hypothetical protein P8Y53_02225, partial [Pseudolabrys sp.]
ITPKGKAALQDYVSEPVRASVTRDEVLLRIFFGNFANKKTIGRELESYLDRIRHERSYLEATKARIDAHPGRKHEARRFQLLSLRLKVAQYRAMEQELAGFLADEIAEQPQVRESACQPERGATSAKRRAKRHSVGQG